MFVFVAPASFHIMSVTNTSKSSFFKQITDGDFLRSGKKQLCRTGIDYFYSRIQLVYFECFFLPLFTCISVAAQIAHLITSDLLV